MAIIPINVYGDRILRKKANHVNSIDDSIVKFIEDMFETMKEAYGVGLSANQVGLDKAIFTVDLSSVEGYEKLKPFVLINPNILFSSEEKNVIDEGCLSIPGVRAEVERPAQIKVIYFDLNMKENSLEAEGFLARVLQHEFDHLQGIYFVDRISKEAKQTLKDDLKKIMARKIDADYLIADKEKKKKT